MTELSLTPADERLGHAPLSKIKSSLDRLFGGSEWLDWEPETVSLELGLILDDLLIEKISVLKVLAESPEAFSENPLFILFATEVINNNVADFSSTPMPTSLELAFAISEVKKLLEANGSALQVGSALLETSVWILRNEGYSKPLAPFDFVPEERLERGQTSADTEAKQKAIETYIQHMENV